MGTEKCGHSARGNGSVFVCDLAPGHTTLHAERVTLRRSNAPGTYVETTNWGDDGLAPHATKDPRAQR